jgi:hypothetical protein
MDPVDAVTVVAVATPVEWVLVDVGVLWLDTALPFDTRNNLRL